MNEVFDGFLHADAILEPFLSEQELKSLEDKRFYKMKKMVKSQVYHWEPIDFSGSMVYQYLIARSAAEYSALYKIFCEIAMRDPDFRPQSLLDFGSGIATTTW